MGRKRPPRIQGFDYVGFHAYSLTICVENRRDTFADPICARAACGQLLSTAVNYGFAVIAYCLMPDHLHVLPEALRPDANCRKFVSMFKQCSSFEYRRVHKQRLWQEGFFDHVLRDDEPLLGVAPYILNNPIRARLCSTIREYPFLGSDRYTLVELIDAVQFEPERGSRRSRPARGGATLAMRDL